jgi:hypothetical protein
MILDLWKAEEMKELADGIRPRTLPSQRVAHLCQQGELLTVTDLSPILGASSSTVCHAMQTWEEAHGQLLPTCDTIHNLVSTISHKKQIVALHLQDYSPSEIARMTNHDPHNVDRYLKDFEQVYDMARDSASLNKICFLADLNPCLVKEYLKLIWGQGLIPGPTPATPLSKGGEIHASTCYFKHHLKPAGQSRASGSSDETFTPDCSRARGIILFTRVEAIQNSRYYLAVLYNKYGG